MSSKNCHPIVNLQRCKGCGLCIAFCPKDVFEADYQGKCLVSHPEKCIGCMSCDYHCPDFAVELIFADA